MSANDNPCIFCKIVASEIPADIVWQSDTVMAFNDIAPLAEVHVLVVPKAHFTDVVDLAANGGTTLNELVVAAREVANKSGHSDFKIVFNTGALAGQTVFHAHAHIIAGARLSDTSSVEVV